MILASLQERDFEMHAVGTAVEVAAPIETPAMGDLHQLTYASFLADQCRSLAELVVAIIDVESAAERVVAQRGTKAPS